MAFQVDEGAAARSKPTHQGLKLLPINVDRHVLLGRFEHALYHRVDHEPGLSDFHARSKSALSFIELNLTEAFIERLQVPALGFKYTESALSDPESLYGDYYFSNQRLIC